MASITLKGNPIETIGNLPKNGTKATDFSLVATDLSVKNLGDFNGSKLILNIFQHKYHYANLPSLFLQSLNNHIYLHKRNILQKQNLHIF